MLKISRLDWGRYKKGIRGEEGMLTTGGFDSSEFFFGGARGMHRAGD